MAIENNITRENFAQSQIFKNIFCAGMNMAAFISKAEFSCGQKESAEKLINNWSSACKDFADDEIWVKSQYNELIDDVTEYLAKAKAMTEMALEAEFGKISPEILHGYFWTLSSLISSAELVFENF